MKLYYFIGRLSSPVQLAFFVMYNKLFRTPRARVIVWNENDELLLVRNWAGKQQWGLPGGGVERNERPVNAAKRELYEEIGVNVSLKDLVHVATLPYQYEAWIYSTSIKEGDLPVKPHNPWEIIDIQWFSLKKLPTDLSPLIPSALKNLSKSK